MSGFQTFQDYFFPPGRGPAAAMALALKMEKPETPSSSLSQKFPVCPPGSRVTGEEKSKENE